MITFEFIEIDNFNEKIEAMSSTILQNKYKRKKNYKDI